MCNCIQEREKQFTDLLFEHVPNARVTQTVEIQNKARMPPSGEWRLYSEIFGRYEDGPRRKVFKQNLFYKFCPFCGEAITPEP